CHDCCFYEILHLLLNHFKCLLPVVYHQESAFLFSPVLADNQNLDYPEADFTLSICWPLISASHDPPLFPEHSGLLCYFPLFHGGSGTVTFCDRQSRVRFYRCS